MLYLHLPKTATDSLFDFKKVSVLSPGLLRSYHQLGYALLASSKCLSSQNFTLLLLAWGSTSSSKDFFENMLLLSEVAYVWQSCASGIQWNFWIDRWCWAKTCSPHPYCDGMIKLPILIVCYLSVNFHNLVARLKLFLLNCSCFSLQLKHFSPFNLSCISGFAQRITPWIKVPIDPNSPLGLTKG